MNFYGYNPEICTDFLNHPQQNNPNGQVLSYCNEFADFSGLQHHHFHQHHLVLDHGVGDQTEVPDIPDTCFNYISNLLRENYSEYDSRPGATLQDYMAAQVSYNKSLDAALHLGETSSFSVTHHHHHHHSDLHYLQPVCQESRHCLDNYLNMFSTNLSNIGNNSSSNNIAACVDGVNERLIYQNSLVGTGNVSNDSLRYQNTLIGNVGDCNNGSFSCQNTLVGNVGASNGGNNVGCSNFSGIGESSHNRVGEIPAAMANGGELLHQYEEALRFIDENWQLVGPAVSNSSSGTEEIRQCQRVDNSQLAEVQGGTSYEQQNNMAIFSSTLVQDPIHQIGLLSSNCADFSENHEVVQAEFGRDCVGDKRRGRKQDNGNEVEDQQEGNGRSKQLAPSNEWCEEIEKYGDVLLCPEGRSKPGALCSSSKSQDKTEEQKGGKSSKGTKKRGSKGQVVDLRALLTRCAQCVARVDLTGAYELLKQIREHASPYGDFLQRVAYYLANGLEARLEGKGAEISRANEDISACDVLKANRVFVASVPFKIMSYYTTNKTIASLVEVAPSIHIIDFGIYYGLQWPCIIQNLSKRPNGPPKLRVTGIDFPQRGFRPAERVEETGRCLAMYCEKYNVPFEYHAIAKPWETIQLEDLIIDRNEPLVVNCLYRSHNLFDESVDESSPRDAFLRLVRKIKPDIFMHGIVNSTSSVPFFLNRFKEVMFHYSALFDIFESTMSREDDERMLLESKLYGNQALNVIACEGSERVERPETYKQWQIRTQRAGFEQVPLDRDLVRRARAMVRRSFREEFSYDTDGHWVVQGWKGRILYAISCWKPAE